MNEIRTAFLEASRGIRPLLESPELAARWNDESALAGFSVRGLAGHLVRAVQGAVGYLAQDVPEGAQPVPARDYYATVLRSLGDTGNKEVIIRGEDNARGGVEELIAAYNKAVIDLEAALRTEPSDRLVRVFMNVVLRYDDYLPSRMCELLIHADDLAVSLGVDPPTPPQSALDVAIEHLVEVARRVHGDRAVLIALSRRERDHVDALRVF